MTNAVSSNQVKFLASSLGFDACGIVPVNGGETSFLKEDSDRLKQWVTQGFHGTMKYLEDFESRAKKFWKNFPEAKSIIVVGVNYYSQEASQEKSEKRKMQNYGAAARRINCPEGTPKFFTLHSPFSALEKQKPPTGRVARYAWGKDYHRVIGKRLEEFRDKLSGFAGRAIRAEVCVDTKPLLERSLAQRAGLGFIGKQSQLLSPKFGPWLFLGELVTDLELEPDIPYVGSCGSCRICIDECPTEAIQETGGIDARRCIAYLTIEHKGEISESLRPLVGDRVFGCDICLQVCPYASKGKETHWQELKPESGQGPFLNLLELLEISSNRSYERKFSGTAITRASRKQLFRNAQIVLPRGF